MSKDDRPDDDWTELTDAARGLERELRRFEERAAEARRAKLDTRKGIERAAKLTTEAAGAQGAVEQALGALVQAITVVRERHEANVAALQVRGDEISRRAAEFAALLERFSGLGHSGSALTARVGELAEQRLAAGSPEGMRAMMASIAEVEDQMAKLVEESRSLAQDAAGASILDLAQQAESLNQQVVAARNKLGLLRKSLAVEPPDTTKLN